MKKSEMLSNHEKILKITVFFLMIIILGLTGSMCDPTMYKSNSRINFGLFTAIFGILTSSIYGLISFFWNEITWPIILTTFDFFNTLFTFSAATAIAVGLEGQSCLNQLVLDLNQISQGNMSRCRKAQASSVFLYFSFFAFLVSMFFSVSALFQRGLFGTSVQNKQQNRVVLLKSPSK